MDGKDRRAASLLYGLAFALTPVVLFAPDLRFSALEWLEWTAALVFRPWHTVAVAAPSAEASALPVADVTMVRALRDCLAREVAGSHPGVTQVPVLGVEGRGGAGLPDHLVLDRAVSRETAGLAQGQPVVTGEDLLGFVAPPHEPFDGLLRVRLLHAHGAAPTRWAAIARSETDAGLPPLQLLVQAAGRSEPYPLQVILAAPRQLDTFSPAHYPYLAVTAASEYLHPDLAPGLVVGTVEDIGYHRPAFVLKRYVAPRWDPRGLVRVGVLGLPPEAAQELAASEDRLPGTSRAAVAVVWRSPAALGYRRYIVRGDALRQGGAVFQGLRCLGRVQWVRAGLGVAVPIGSRGQVLPLVWLAADGRRSRMLLVRGLGGEEGLADFAVVHPPGLPDATLDGGALFTGVVGGAFPHGLRVGRVTAHSRGRFRAETFGAEEWPEFVWVAIPGGA